MNNLGAVIRRDDDQVALVDLSNPGDPRTFTFADLQRLANGVAAELGAEPGMISGTRIGILAYNSVEYLAVLLGIMRAGGVAVPINFKFPDAIVHYVVSDAALATVFADQQNRDRLPPETIVRDMTSATASATADLLPAPREGIKPSTFPIIEPEPDEPGLILYTSGSTGRPKGVVLSHASQLSMVERIGSRWRDSTAIVAAPLYHMNGMLTSFMNLYSGGRLILMPKFDARVYLKAIETYSVNSITGVPTMLAMMLREQDLIESLDFASVTTVSIGSAPLSETVANQALTVFPNAAIANSYGTTEAGAGMFGPHPDRLPTPRVSLGYPQPHIQVRLVDGTSEREGVLEVKTAAAMNEYLNLPEKTSAKTTADGWVTTGDTMRVDDNGFYFFVGRDDDMFNCSGENVYPGEIERILESDPRIAECSVVPLADDIRGQVPVAFIVANTEIAEQTVKDIVLANAPAYMHPRHVIFLQAMPLAGTNKIGRKTLEETAAAQISRN